MSAEATAVSVTLEVPTAGTATSSTATPLGHSGPLPITGVGTAVLIVAAMALILAGLLILAIIRTRMEPANA